MREVEGLFWGSGLVVHGLLRMAARRAHCYVGFPPKDFHSTIIIGTFMVARGTAGGYLVLGSVGTGTGPGAINSQFPTISNNVLVAGGGPLFMQAVVPGSAAEVRVAKSLK